MVISQVNENYGTVAGKAHICKDNTTTCISESFSELLTGFVSDEADTEGGSEGAQLISFLKLETDQALSEEYSGNNYFMPVVYMPSVNHTYKFNGYIVHNMNTGALTGDIVHNIILENSDDFIGHNKSFIKYSSVNGNDLHEAYKNWHFGQSINPSGSVGIVSSKTESKNDLQNQPIVLSDALRRDNSLIPAEAREIMHNESTAFKEGELSSEKHYHSEDVDMHSAIIRENIRKHVSISDFSGKSDDYAILRHERPISESSVYESDLSKTLKQDELAAHEAEYGIIKDFRQEAENHKEQRYNTGFILNDKFQKFSAFAGAEEKMYNESTAFKGSKPLNEKKHYAVDVNADSAVIHENILKNVPIRDLSGKFDDYVMLRYARPISESSAYESNLSDAPKQTKLTAQADAHPKAITHSFVYDARSSLISEEIKLIKEENLDQLNENLKDFSIRPEDGPEPTPAKSQSSSCFDSLLGSSGEERFWEHNDASQLDSSFKTVLFQAAYPSEPISKLPEALDKITSKEDLLTLVAERLSVLSVEGRAELEIKIHPESLGKLLLKVVNENGLYSAQITAETFQTKELLQSHLNDLKASLKELGFDFIRLDVDLSNNQSNNRQWSSLDRFLTGRNNYGSIASGLSDQVVERVERTYSKLKVPGHIDCLV
jgi:flagellar hook-length control protein FliK